MFCRSGPAPAVNNGQGSKGSNSLVFDKETGNFIVTVRLKPEEYGRLVQEQVIAIADIDSLVFKKETGEFEVPVFMSPEEYGKYVKDNILPWM